MDGAAAPTEGKGHHAFGDAYLDRLVEIIARHLEVEPHHGVLCEPYEPHVARALVGLGCLHSPPRPWGPGETGAARGAMRGPDRALVMMLDTGGGEEEGSLQSPSEATLARVLSSLPAGGRLLVVRRPHGVCSLPLFSAARRRLHAPEEASCTKIISCLKDVGADVEWDVARIPITVSKSGWLGVLRGRRLGLLSAMSDRDIREGIRELCEGCLKYSGDTLAFEDLVMFITATRRTAHEATHHPHVQRRGSGLHPAPSPCEPQYKLPLTHELRALLATKTTASADAPLSHPPPPPPPQLKRSSSRVSASPRNR
ncbi:uncharacterized protein LOC133347655 isoform X2 [Lethenteron reissneri]|nr:uncharacterized protein LOC133347655 isoform X2 [Lethenteron reissneri]XP_061416105.1 uncharacterized protein LOC133347655 isoform X2 [Lethenteron reissneri]XP_061416106.1 uncharacterized protein LOC133347655 isoform X2 [Lethenteron reissneri]XP_061416107.1 uncharacterized protein LOC133347655 isoform X2 [Lethenteron reissneri]